jgi:hypothetical protein
MASSWNPLLVSIRRKSEFAHEVTSAAFHPDVLHIGTMVTSSRFRFPVIVSTLSFSNCTWIGAGQRHTAIRAHSRCTQFSKDGYRISTSKSSLFPCTEFSVNAALQYVAQTCGASVYLDICGLEAWHVRDEYVGLGMLLDVHSSAGPRLTVTHILLCRRVQRWL